MTSRSLLQRLLNTPWKYILLMPIFYLSGESPPFIFVIHFVKKKLITKSVPVLKLPEKKCIIPSSRNISVKLLRNQVSVENISIKVSALNHVIFFFCPPPKQLCKLRTDYISLLLFHFHSIHLILSRVYLKN